MFKNNKYFKFLFGFTVFAFSFLEGSDIIDRRFNISIDSNTILIILLVALIGGLIYTYYEEKSDKETEKKENEIVKKDETVTTSPITIHIEQFQSNVPTPVVTYPSEEPDLLFYETE